MCHRWNNHPLNNKIHYNRSKSKGPTSSGPANSTCTGNTIHVSSMPKSMMMYGSNGTGALASSTHQLEDIENFGDVGSLDDNVESFMHDDGDGGNLFGTLKRNPSDNAKASKSFSFNEVGSICKSNGKVVCCHFSTDGKLLASVGHDKKVVIWNMETLQTESTPEEHTHIITDVRFRLNSTQLAASSFHSSGRLWDAAESLD